MRFYLLEHPFLHPFLSQITTATTRTDTALPDTMTGETATAVIATGIGIVTTDATGIEDMTGTVIDGTMTDGPGDTKDEGTGESARRDLVQGAKTKCRLTPRRRMIVVTETEDEPRSVEGMAWELRNEEAPPHKTRCRSL